MADYVESNVIGYQVSLVNYGCLAPKACQGNLLIQSYSVRLCNRQMFITRWQLHLISVWSCMALKVKRMYILQCKVVNIQL